jgi:hypothetical protein
MSRKGLKPLPKVVLDDQFVLTQQERELLKPFAKLKDLWGYPGTGFEARSETEGRIFLQNYTDLLFRGLYNTFELGYSTVYDVFEKLSRQNSLKWIPMESHNEAMRLIKEFFRIPEALKLVSRLAKISIRNPSYGFMVFKFAARQLLLLRAENWEEAYTFGQWFYNGD